MTHVSTQELVWALTSICCCCIVTSALVYDLLVYPLVENDRESHLEKTAKAYFSTMMHLARDQCFRLETKNNKKVRAETRLFFSCLIPKGTNEEAKWMYGVKKNIVRFLFEVFKKTGETIDHSVQPSYKQHVFDLVQAYTNHGWTPENSRRSLEVNGLRQVAGRPAEMAWLLTESMDFDPFYKQLFSELPGVCVCVCV